MLMGDLKIKAFIKGKVKNIMMTGLSKRRLIIKIKLKIKRIMKNEIFLIINSSIIAINYLHLSLYNLLLNYFVSFLYVN